MGPRLSSGRGVEGPRSAPRPPADVRTPERHPAVRRSGEGPVDRGTHPAGIAGGRLESPRPAAAHAPWRPDRPGRPPAPPPHTSSRWARPPAVLGLVQLQLAEEGPHAIPA